MNNWFSLKITFGRKQPKQLEQHHHLNTAIQKITTPSSAIQYHHRPFEYRIYRLHLIRKFEQQYHRLRQKLIKQNKNTTTGHSNIEYTGYI